MIAPTDPWGELRLPGPPEPSNLPLDAFPPVLRDYIEATTHSIQVPVDLFAGLVLGAVSACVGGRFEVCVDDAWTREWSVLYTVGVAPPAERKSEALRRAFRPVKEWQDAKREEVLPQHRTALQFVEIAEKRLKDATAKAAVGNATDAEVENAVLELEVARQAVPRLPDLLVGDVTPEALVLQMERTGGRVVICSPEGGPLRIIDGRYSDGAARLEEYAQAYDGEPLRVGRVDRRSTVEAPALTLAVTIQPSVLDSIRNGRSMRGQGIFGRICWIKPRSRLGTRKDSSEVPGVDPKIDGLYHRALHTLLDWSPDERAILALSPEAARVKRDYFYAVERELAAGGRYAGIRDWAGKAVGRAVRIAALLDLVSRASDGRSLTGDPISKWAMQSGARITEALATHTLDVFAEAELDTWTSDLRYILRRIQELPGERTVNALNRAVQGRASIDGIEGLTLLLDELEVRSCVRRWQRPSDGPGRPSMMIELHPSLRAEVEEIEETPGERVLDPDSLNFLNARAEVGAILGREVA